MCMCIHVGGKPNINGQHGYCWNNANAVGIHPINPPELRDGETLIFDEPGRCGGVDAHSHHFRLVFEAYGNGSAALLVRNGGGEERFPIAKWMPALQPLIDSMRQMDTHGRYWAIHLLYSIHRKATDEAMSAERSKWIKAAREKRIKVKCSLLSGAQLRAIS